MMDTVPVTWHLHVELTAVRLWASHYGSRMCGGVRLFGARGAMRGEILEMFVPFKEIKLSNFFTVSVSQTVHRTVLAVIYLGASRTIVGWINESPPCASCQGGAHRRPMVARLVKGTVRFIRSDTDRRQTCLGPHMTLSNFTHFLPRSTVPLLLLVTDFCMQSRVHSSSSPFVTQPTWR